MPTTLDERFREEEEDLYAISEPQVHYTLPFPQFEKFWKLFTFGFLPLCLLITLLMPDEPGTPFVVAYFTFLVSGGVGLIFLFLTHPAVGVWRKVFLPRGSWDHEAGRSGERDAVEVYIMRPLFGRRKCERIGGKIPHELCVDGKQDLNLGYVRYRVPWGEGVVRVRWDRAVFVVGEGEAEDCTDVVGKGGVTRLRWLRGKEEERVRNREGTIPRGSSGVRSGKSFTGNAM